MVEAVIFAILGWLIFDFAKHKRLTKENVASSLILAIIAGAGWYFIERFIS